MATKAQLSAFTRAQSSRHDIPAKRAEVQPASKPLPKIATGKEGVTPVGSGKAPKPQVRPASARRGSRRNPRVSAFIPGGRIGKRSTIAGISVDPQIVLTAGFVICVMVTLAEAMTGTDQHGKDKNQTFAHHMMVREIAVCAVFLVLSIVAMTGSLGGKIASGTTVLIVAATVFGSADLVAFAAKVLNPAAAGSTPEGALTKQQVEAASAQPAQNPVNTNGASSTVPEQAVRGAVGESG